MRDEEERTIEERYIKKRRRERNNIKRGEGNNITKRRLID